MSKQAITLERTIAGNIRAERARRGLSREDVCSGCDVTIYQLRQFEAGDFCVRCDRDGLIKIARSMGVAESSLIPNDATTPHTGKNCKNPCEDRDIRPSAKPARQRGKVTKSAKPTRQRRQGDVAAKA